MTNQYDNIVNTSLGLSCCLSDKEKAKTIFPFVQKHEKYDLYISFLFPYVLDLENKSGEYIKIWTLLYPHRMLILLTVKM